MNYLIKTGVFFLAGNYLCPSNNYRQVSFKVNAVVLILIICKDLRNWYKVYLHFSFFNVFLKNRNIISKIKRSKVTDYAALRAFDLPVCIHFSAIDFWHVPTKKNMRTRNSRLVKTMRPRQKVCVPMRVILPFRELWSRVHGTNSRVRATDRHCRKMRRNNKFGAKNINLATTIGERKIASKFFRLASESSPPATSHCLVPLNGHQCVS